MPVILPEPRIPHQGLTGCLGDSHYLKKTIKEVPQPISNRNHILNAKDLLVDSPNPNGRFSSNALPSVGAMFVKCAL